MKLEDVLKERIEELLLKEGISVNALATRMGVKLHDHQEYPIWEKLQSNDPHYFSAQFCL